MTITKRGVGSLSDLLQKRMGEMISRADPETLMAVSLLRTKTRRGKGEDAAGEEIRILLARRASSHSPAAYSLFALHVAPITNLDKIRNYNITSFWLKFGGF